MEYKCEDCGDEFRDTHDNDDEFECAICGGTVKKQPLNL